MFSDYTFPNYLIVAVMTTAFSALIRYTPRDEEGRMTTGVKSIGELAAGGKANSNDSRIKKRRTSVSPQPRKSAAAAGRRSNSPAARDTLDASGDGDRVEISEKIKARKATPKPLRKSKTDVPRKSKKSKSKSPQKLSRGNTLIKRIDEGDYAKVLLS